MMVRAIQLDFFRNYLHLEAGFHPRVNVIWGENAQGKTNLLEAIAYLSTASSHRARYDRELIQMGVDHGFIQAQVSARQYASQGQTRTAALSLKLACREIFFQETGEWPVLLLDDVLSELDQKRQEYVLKRITGGQVFITCCEEMDLSRLGEGRTFHIRDGALAG